MVFLKEVFEKNDFEKNQQTAKKKHENYAVDEEVKNGSFARIPKSQELDGSFSIPDRWQFKTLSTIDEPGSKTIETVFSIAICRQ